VKAVLKSSGLPLGMWPDSRYETSARIGLEPEDIVVLLTDGVTETSDREDLPFGADRVLQVIREHRRESAQRILLAVREAARKFAGSQHQQDDMAIILCRMKT
jgi:sigma-B regulation protein RsbU (phosphoserine phosphatase)